jgi:signal transduction histidine kinase
MTIATGNIRAEPHAELGAILMRDADEIVEHWCERARAEQPGAARLHHDVLRNQLRGFLRAMGSGIRQAGQHNPREHRDNAIEHGEQRWDHGWSISELVRDYQILQTLLLEYSSHALQRPLAPRETMAIAVFINDAIAASIAAYVANRDHEIRDVERAGLEAIQEAYRRKDAFLAVVVHELRNPVFPIASSAHVLSLLLPEADARVREAIGVIVRQSRHLGRLLDDLTDLTRLAQGRMHLDRQVVDLGTVLEQAIETSRAFIESRRHRLSLDVPAGPLMVDCDPTRMAQVFVNLLNNASKYTPPGGEIFVTAVHSGPVVELRVRDSGIGIPPDKVEQVFDLYTRLTSADEHSADGLGIGLALVRDLVALHDGTVDCHSDGQGTGAEFVVRLPAYSRPGRD